MSEPGKRILSLHVPSRSLRPLAAVREEPPIRQLGTHLSKDIVLGFDRHLSPADADAYTALLRPIAGCVIAAPTSTETHWIEVAERVGLSMLEAPARVGVLICSTGIGMSIAANKFPGLYAARCLSVEDAYLARTINNANVLCLASRSGFETNRDIIDEFFGVAYEGRKLPQLESIMRLEDRQHQRAPDSSVPRLRAQGGR